MKLPPVSLFLGEKPQVVGGWMLASLLTLRKSFPGVEFAVATLDKRKSLFHEKIDGVDYYLLPERSRQKYDGTLEPLWIHVRDEFRPDVVHIHGTEQPHGLAYLNACGCKGVVSSIQGLVDVYASYYLEGISGKDLFHSATFADLISGRLLWMREIAFKLRGRLENKHLQLLENVIGRTAWDEAHVRSVNPKARYLFVNETLRSEFYTGTWEYSKCVPHTIFLSQAGYPIKGLHFLIKALPLILREFPDTQVFIGGANILKKSGFSMGGYGKLCQKLMRERDIEGRFHFLGPLSAEEMKAQYLSANVFVSPSTIENSPNSVCEAQMLGTPVVSSEVGGVLDLVEHKKTGFVYRCEDVTLLAHWICHVFRERERMDDFVERMQYAARLRHDGVSNARRLKEVYDEIASSSD